ICEDHFVSRERLAIVPLRVFRELERVGEAVGRDVPGCREIGQWFEVEAVSEQARIYLRRDELVLRGDVQRQNEGGRLGLEDDVHDAAATRLLGAGTAPGKGERGRGAADQAGRGERCRRSRGTGYEVTTI